MTLSTIEELTTKLREIRLQEAEITAQLEAAVREHAPPPVRNTTNAYPFAVGDRVRIKNKIRKPADWENQTTWSETEARTARVTNILRRGDTIQIHFITDNGVNTWGAPNNLCHIQPTFCN